MKIKEKLLLWFIPLFAVSLFSAVFINYFASRETVKSEIENSLNGIAVITKHKIEEYIIQNEEKVKLIAIREALKEKLYFYLKNNDSGVKASINKSLTDIRNSTPEFREVGILSDEGEIIAASDMDSEFNKYIKETFYKYIKDIENGIVITKYGEKHRLVIWEKVLLEEEIPVYITVTAGVEKIFKTLDEKTGIGHTGEYLFYYYNNENLIWLNSNKDKKENEVITFIKRVTNSQNNILWGKDYKEREVLAVYVNLNPLNGGIVLKREKNEIFRNIDHFSIIYLIISILILDSASKTDKFSKASENY